MIFKKLFWKYRFKKALKRRTFLTWKELDGVCDGELDSWFEHQEWKDWTPEDAVTESLSYWED